MRLAGQIGGVLVFATLLFGTYYLTSVEGELAWTGERFPVKAFVATGGLMLFGIAFGSLFRQIQGRTEAISIAVELRRMWSSSSFWAAILVSPLVFGGVFVGVGEAPIGPTAYLLAFQNGFFCESVFKRMLTADGRPQSGAS